jgi:benzoate-CoA ligase
MNAVEFLLGHQALAEHGDRTALICGEVSTTYRQLADAVRRASGAVASLGVRPGDTVLLLMRDTPEFAAAWLGVLGAGAVAVAVNHKLTEPEHRHIVVDSNTRLAIVEEHHAPASSKLIDQLAQEGRLVLVGSERPDVPEWRSVLRNAPDSAPFDIDDEAPAFSLYSSGTTGRPKGVVHSHRSVLHVGLALRKLDIGPDDIVFTTSKYFFAYGLEHGLLGTLAVGASSVLSPDWPERDALADLVERHRPTAMFSVPTVYRRLLSEATLEPFGPVRYFIAAGERLSPQLVAQWRAATGGELLNLYGTSETFCACMLTRPGTSDGVRTGEPFSGVEVRLADAQGREPPPGRPGVLWVRHPAQAAKYANLPGQTQEQFRDGWFCTRDVFLRDSEGFFVHQGRSDDLVKVAGQWVQPAELEEAVAAEPTIAEAACFSMPDHDGLERLALFVTPRGDRAVALRAAAEACERALPRHKRPKWIRAIDELPRTATGKIQRYKLREILESERVGKG